MESKSELFEECEYYKNYMGPELTSVEVEGIENSYLHNKIRELYGPNLNWNEKIYQAGLIITEEYLNKNIKLNFVSTSGRTHWTEVSFKNYAEILNPPLFMPYNQNLLKN